MSLQVAELHRPASVLRPHLPPGAVRPHSQFQGNAGGVSSDKTPRLWEEVILARRWK